MLKAHISELNRPDQKTNILQYLTLAVSVLFAVIVHLHNVNLNLLTQNLNAHLDKYEQHFQQYLKYQDFVNNTLQQQHQRGNIILKSMTLFEKSMKLDLITETHQLNQSLTTTNAMINQLDESITNLGNIHIYQQFLKRKQMINEVIQKNQTLQKFQDSYNESMDQFKLSLNNIDNPYYDLHSRENHQAQMEQLLAKEYKNYQSKYEIDKYNYELSMCIIVSTRNNIHQNRYLYNIKSILNQDYRNYFVVIMDDASTDMTGLHIERYLRIKDVGSDQVVVVKRNERQGSLANIDYAIRTFCKDYTITLPIDGDDQLLGNKVFKLFNAIYQSKNPGVAYSNHIYYMQDQQYLATGYSKPYSKLAIEKQSFRKMEQIFGHLRSFRTEIYFKINEQDLRDTHGRFYMAAGDEAIFFPLLQMSCKNIEFINETTYLYNAGTGNNVRKLVTLQQETNAIYIRLLKKYTCLPQYKAPFYKKRN